MKRSKWLMLPLLVAVFSTAQAQEEAKPRCHDVLYLKDGSVFRGQILEYDYQGDVRMKTWSGAEMKLPAVNVKKVIQKCRHDKKESTPTPSLSELPYSFREHGWYHATRIAGLAGDSGLGYGIQHSSGYMFSRLAGVGLGVGFENFDPQDTDVPTYPLFAEFRGYLLSKNITPFFNIGLGYGFSSKKIRDISFDLPTETWKGGWMAQGQIGYRLGNHATMHLGIRLQRKIREWQSAWFEGSGTDRILHKRFDIGFGILF